MKCNICERGCIITEGKTGICGLYENRERQIVERFPDQYLVACPISIETMPILHFYPGGKFLQISTVGCNFACPGCISTVIVKEMEAGSKALVKLAPEEVVAKALANQCLGIAFLMNDPLVSFPTFVKVARLAKEQGLLVGCSSNAYFTETALDALLDCLDFINVGVKGISDYDQSYCGGQSIAPVIRNIQQLYDSGVHVEVSSMYRYGQEAELRQLAGMIADISRVIPFQVMRFIPLESTDVSLEPTIRDAEAFCRILKEELDYVYLFNSPGTTWLNTVCPECGKTVIKRDFYGPMGAKLITAAFGTVVGKDCPDCGAALKIKGTQADIKYREGAFEGGYPFTRALEMIEAILITIGVNDQKQIVQIWEEVLGGNQLNELHHQLQNLTSYIHLIRDFGRRTGLNERAETLATYMEKKLAFIRERLPLIGKKPRVYYAMGKPLFCLKGERLENQLVEAAGGRSVNREIECDGRPGMQIPVAVLNELNPDMIFISSFIGNPVEEFTTDCERAGVNVNAVRNRKIYAHPAPGWDFGSPRWILGLMYIANILHPQLFQFEVMREAERFYRQFYQTDFCLSELNRSFSKPNNKWELVKSASIR